MLTCCVRRSVPVLLLAGILAASCAKPNRRDLTDVDRPDGAGGNQSGGRGGNSAVGGSSGASGAGNSGGASIDAPAGGSAGGDVDADHGSDDGGPACNAGATRCVGATVEVCKVT